MNRFSKYSWFLVVWTVLVIAWGTVVRATNSGAGCGNFWPLCSDSIIPSFEVFHTVIEFTHRVMSGLLLVLIFFLAIWGRKVYRFDNYRRKIVYSTLFFTIVEALLGAGLVVLGLVDDNDSHLRIVAVSIHLLNTFVLLGVLTMNAWWSNHELPLATSRDKKKSIHGLIISLILIIGVSGAITALADTLFPSDSILHTLNEVSDQGSHLLKTLRIYHPILAILFGFGIIHFLVNKFVVQDPRINKLKNLLVFLIILQFVLGFLNILFLTPLVIQVFHLIVADCIWITVVILFLMEAKDRVPNING